MTKLEEQSYIHLIKQLREENEALKAELVAMRKLYINKTKKKQ